MKAHLIYCGASVGLTGSPMKYELSRPRAVSIAVVLGSFFFLASRSSQAQQATFDLDPAKTTVTFTLGDVLHTVHGTFKAKTGHVTFDLASGAASGGFVIDATSGDSGNHTRDRIPGIATRAFRCLPGTAPARAARASPPAKLLSSLAEKRYRRERPEASERLLCRG